jgi:hypothetical protein
MLASTEYATVPDPVPLLPDVMWIQLAAVEAVHGHAEFVVTVKLRAAPSEEIAPLLAGLST